MSMIEEGILPLLEDGSERKRLIGQEWRHFSDTYSESDDNFLVYRNYRNLIEPYNPNYSFAEPSHCALRLIINNQDIQDETSAACGRTYWFRNGRNLRILDISLYGTQFTSPSEILLSCPNLEQLTIALIGKFNKNEELNLSRLANVEFPKLVSLKVRCGSQLGIKILEAIILRAPILGYLSFICRGETCKSYILNNINFKKKTHLKGIDIQSSVIYEGFINAVTLNLSSQLETLSISDCSKLSDLIFINVQDRCKNLKQLMIGNWNSDTENFKGALLTLTKLTAISLFSSQRITNTEVAILKFLPCLARLDISNCENVTNTGIYNVFENTSPFLIELRLINLHITDDLITKISENLPNLEILNLSYCKELSVLSLDAVALHNRNLKCLLIDGCNWLGETIARSFQGDVPSCLNELLNLVHFGAKDLMYLAVACNRNLQLPRLAVIDIFMAPVSYRNLKLRCPSLKYVGRYSCTSRLSTIDDSIVVAKRMRILECYRSPFGPCNFVGKFQQ